VGRPSRRPVKKNGLPQYVTQHFDRHGRLRTRFRKTGLVAMYAQSVFPSREFWVEYDAWLNGDPKPAGIDRAAPGTIADLVGRFFANPARLGPTPDTQGRNRRILDSFRQEHGDRLVEDVRFDALDNVIAQKAENTPWQAKKLRRLLNRLFAYAVKLRMVETNPVPDTETIKATTEGWHTWTEGEIAQFVQRHPLGTKAYLAMMLMLWTSQRRSDAVRLCRGDVKDGWIKYRVTKTKRMMAIPIAGQLAEAIAAMPVPDDVSDETTFLRTEYGRPFSAKGFGAWFRKRCDEAELYHCSAHGLRKANARRAAEIGLSNQSIKSVTGHSTDSEVSRYTAKAEQAAMARDAIDKMSAWYLSNPVDRLDK
jgi:integrase